MDVTLTISRWMIGRIARQEYLRQVRARARDLRPAWRSVLEVIYRRQERLFDNEGANTEEPRWPRLSDNPIRFHRLDGQAVGYSTWKRRFYPGRKILELTGKLKRQVTGLDPAAFVQRGPRKLRFGTHYTNYGDVPGRPRSRRDRLTGDLGGITAEGRPDYFPMPDRQVFRVDQPYEDEIGDVLLDYLLLTPVPLSWFRP